MAIAPINYATIQRTADIETFKNQQDTTQAFYGTYSTDLGLVMAALLLAMLPILVLYLFLQRYIVEGVTSGAVKG